MPDILHEAIIALASALIGGSVDLLFDMAKSKKKDEQTERPNGKHFKSERPE